MTKKYPNLKNPPIKEVVVGISVELSMEEINNLCQELIEEYPVKNEIKVSSIEGNDKGIQSINIDTNGYMLQAKNTQNKVFLEKNRIAYSVRNKYVSFDDLKENYRKIIDALQKTLSSKKGIGEIGLRYINKVNNLTNMALFNIQLNIRRKKIFPFVAKFEKNNENIRSIVNVIENKSPKGTYEITLDIDSHAQISSLDDINDTLEKMRKEKNEIFFSCFDESLIKNWE